jgi:dolichol-phosphate mannosyltransferase
MKRISFVVPAYNEAASIPHLFARIAQVMGDDGRYAFEVIFVDDGSSDGTLAVLEGLSQRDARAQFVSLSRNFGHQVALSAGLDAAQGDAVVFLDGDLQHPPEIVPQLLRAWESGAHIVNTVRADDPDLSLFKRVTSRGFYFFVNLLADVSIQPNSADFRLLDRSAADALRQVQERSRFIRGLVQWIGFQQETVAYTPEKRFAGKTKFSPRKMWRLALDGIFSFSTTPLQIATWSGVIVSMGAFSYAIYALYEKLVSGKTVQGWTSIVVVTLLLGGIQLITLGILGSYVARIYEEVRRRPLYLVKANSRKEATKSNLVTKSEQQ